MQLYVADIQYVISHVAMLSLTIYVLYVCYVISFNHHKQMSCIVK